MLPSISSFGFALFFVLFLFLFFCVCSVCFLWESFPFEVANFLVTKHFNHMCNIQPLLECKRWLLPFLVQGMQNQDSEKQVRKWSGEKEGRKIQRTVVLTPSCRKMTRPFLIQRDQTWSRAMGLHQISSSSTSRTSLSNWAPIQFLCQNDRRSSHDLSIVSSTYSASPVAIKDQIWANSFGLLWISGSLHAGYWTPQESRQFKPILGFLTEFPVYGNSGRNPKIGFICFDQIGLKSCWGLKHIAILDCLRSTALDRRCRLTSPPYMVPPKIIMRLCMDCCNACSDRCLQLPQVLRWDKTVKVFGRELICNVHSPTVISHSHLGNTRSTFQMVGANQQYI